MRITPARPLRTGDRVACVAASSALQDDIKLQEGLAVLQSWASMFNPRPWPADVGATSQGAMTRAMPICIQPNPQRCSPVPAVDGGLLGCWSNPSAGRAAGCWAFPT